MHLGGTPITRMGILIALASCSNPPEFPVLEIKDRTPAQVIDILGEPDTSFTQRVATKEIFTQIYQGTYRIEIMYPEGLSTDIVIHDPIRHLPLEPSTITRFGIKEIPPSDELAKGYIKWKNHAGFKTINFFVTDLDSAGNVSQYKIFFKSSGESR